MAPRYAAGKLAVRNVPALGAGWLAARRWPGPACRGMAYDNWVQSERRACAEHHLPARRGTVPVRRRHKVPLEDSQRLPRDAPQRSRWNRGEHTSTGSAKWRRLLEGGPRHSYRDRQTCPCGAEPCLPVVHRVQGIRPRRFRWGPSWPGEGARARRFLRLALGKPGFCLRGAEHWLRHRPSPA